MNSILNTFLVVLLFGSCLCKSVEMDPSSAANTEYQTELGHLRDQIDDLDQKLLNTLAERMLVCGKVGELKKRFDKPVVQPDRVGELLQQFKSAGSEKGLSKEFAAQLFIIIHEESVNIQNKIKNEQ